jgi:cell division protein FtsL
MHRTVNLFLLLAALVSVFALYALKYGTRRLELGVQAQERAVKKLEGEIKALEAEYAHLARPGRIEPLARALGLAPVTRRQYLRLDSVGRAADGGPAPTTVPR